MFQIGVETKAVGSVPKIGAVAKFRNAAATSRANAGAGSLARGFGGGAASSVPGPSGGPGSVCECSK